MTQKTRGTWKNYEAEVVKIWGNRERGAYFQKNGWPVGIREI